MDKGRAVCVGGESGSFLPRIPTHNLWFVKVWGWGLYLSALKIIYLKCSWAASIPRHLGLHPQNLFQKTTL